LPDFHFHLRQNSLWIIFLIFKIKFENDIVQELASINELQKKYDNQKNETNRLIQLLDTLKYQISGSWNEQLRTITKELKFDNKYRITVYLRTFNKFLSFARHSNNPEFSKYGRSYIDNKDEYIYHAWANGEGISEIDNPDNIRNMPSRKIGVFYLYTNDESNKFGIVVFETTDKKSKLLIKTKLKEATHKINKNINESLEIKPDISIAMKEGL